MPNKIGERVRFLRIKNNWLQKELADRTGFTAQKISNIERGFTKEISSEDVGVFSNVFGVSTDFILGITPEMKIKESLKGDEELVLFFNDLSKREDLKLLFKQVKPLKPEVIKRIIKYIKIVEDEEKEE
ncbi:MAG: helix-turn-helix transcriptional regulator [Bacillota bacterium]|nr:helix-turn-helix transcriptional regulator [Bacillota bacterium]